MTARSADDAILCITRDGPSVTFINLDDQHLGDERVGRLLDFLTATPNSVKLLWMDRNDLTDALAEKLARYLVTSSTVTQLALAGNKLGYRTYVALANALCVNESLEALAMQDNSHVDMSLVEPFFIRTLQITRLARGVYWYLTSDKSVFKRLRRVAKRMHPSLQELLVLVD